MGGLNAMTHGNGVTLGLAYDLDGLLAAIDAWNGATPVLDLDYAYDLASNIAAITDAGGGPRGQVFQYDALHRLTAASGTYNAGFAGPPPGIGNKPADRGPAQFPGQARAPIAQGDIAYSYDSVGNRTARLMDLGGATTAETYAYDAFSNRLLSVAAEGGRPNRATTRAISYGDSGNTEADGKDGRSLSYEYDQSDRLVGVSDGGVQIARYAHNAMGQRVVKDTGAGVAHYVYDAGGSLIAEYDAATGAVIAEYVWLGGRPVAHVRDGATFFVHTDHLGTPQLLTDATGKIAWSAVYRPFGETAHVGGAVAFNLRFPGQYFDQETGLYYNYHRDYDPSLGRYIQSDPISLQGGWNTYTYVGGNSLKYADPYGLIALDVAWDLGPGIPEGCVEGAASFFKGLWYFGVNTWRRVTGDPCVPTEDFVITYVAKQIWNSEVTRRAAWEVTVQYSKRNGWRIGCRAATGIAVSALTQSYGVLGVAAVFGDVEETVRRGRTTVDDILESVLGGAGDEDGGRLCSCEQ